MRPAERDPVAFSSIYVHAPFCQRRCTYCDFAVTVRREGDVDGWVKAISAELSHLRSRGRAGLAPGLSTLYVGGGTPSLLGPDAMSALADVIGRDRVETDGVEWTAEANPESFTDDVARAWRRAGVNRLSLGAQTFHEPALRWMGRLHGADGPAAAVGRAKREGLVEINVDLIFALPEHLGRSWRADLDRVIALDVPHVSLYGLSVEPGTPLGRAVQEGREAAVGEQRYAEEYSLAVELLTGAGYEHYEVSNFARPGSRSRHNSVYWSGAPYLGLGNGAHSYAAPVRWWNVREWEDYRARVMAGESPEEECEVVVGRSAELERVWLGLRTSEGLPVPGASTRAEELFDGWVRNGLARRGSGRIRLTASGWLLLDRLAVELDEAYASP
jgi:oxygen-independent coproporphyrinogen-3 oxidase